MGVATVRTKFSASMDSISRSLAFRRHCIRVDQMNAYQGDIPLRVFQYIALGIAYPISRLATKKRLRAADVAHPAVWGSMVLLLYAGVSIFAAMQSNVLFSSSPEISLPLSRDYVQIFLMAAAPLAVALAADFYSMVFPRLKRLHTEGAVSEIESCACLNLLTNLHWRLNSWRWQTVILPVSVVGPISASLNTYHLTSGGSWAFHIPIALLIWLLFISIILWWVTLFFVYKCIIIWKAIRLFTDCKKFRWRKLGEDGEHLNAIYEISTMWFRVHLVVVLIGSFVILYASVREAWTQPVIILGVGLYIVLAPVVFFGPLYTIHRKMKSLKLMEVSAARETHNSARAQLMSRVETGKLGSTPVRDFMLVDFTEKELNRTLKLPTWPLNVAVARGVWATYLLPLPLGIASTWLVRAIDLAKV